MEQPKTHGGGTSGAPLGRPRAYLELDVLSQTCLP